MQEYALIPSLGIGKDDFWEESHKLASSKKMDSILSYMYLILEKAEAIPNVKVTKKDFKALGKSIELFPGVTTWFNRVENIANEMQVDVEPYVISAGIKEIIEGTSISKHFKEIYACSFLYDKYGKAIWPAKWLTNQDTISFSDQ